jgi:lysophospholipase L1-like esterase
MARATYKKRRTRITKIKRTPGPVWSAALARGQRNAQALLTRRAALRKKHDHLRARLLATGKAAADAGGAVLLAEGDSWFDYPFQSVLGELEDRFNYDVQSSAHKGDTIEEMAYDPDQLTKLVRLLEKLDASGKRPKAVLLSGGGNDIAGDELKTLLNHKGSNLPALNEQILAGMIDNRLQVALVTLIGTVTQLIRARFGSVCPVLIHGYDYPVPDGRGYLGGFWTLPGPWLQPGLRKKGYDVLAENRKLMATLIDRFNAMAATVAGGPGLKHVHYVNLRGTLSNELAGNAYQQWWANELHPSERGFEAVANRFHQALRSL